MRYFRIWREFFKMSWMADMEYRMNLLVQVFGDIIWYIAQLSIFEVLFTHTNHIGTWDIHSMRAFMGTLFLVDALYMIFFQNSFDQFSTLVKKGDLDLYLVKPVSSQFMCTFKKINSAYFVNVIFVCCYLAWAFSYVAYPWTIANLLSYSFLLLCGLAMLYAIRFSFCSINVIFHNASNIGFLFFNVYRIGMRPDPFYPQWLRYFILFVIPVGFFASVPARSMVGELDIRYFIAAPTLAVVFNFLANRFWHYSLKKHSSASS